MTQTESFTDQLSDKKSDSLKQNVIRHTNTAQKISIIVPVGTHDQTWITLLDDLKHFTSEVEILFAATKTCPLKDLPQNMRWILCPKGRASQMNFAAKFSTREHLCFIHSDSRISVRSFLALIQSIDNNAHHIHYFDLLFLKDGPALMSINEFGVWIRSRLFKIPFGDQGLCMSSSLFNSLGGFDESLQFAEDYDLILKAKKRKIPISSTHAYIRTSARKYQSKGWLKTTLLHLGLTVKQGILFWKKN